MSLSKNLEDKKDDNGFYIISAYEIMIDMGVTDLKQGRDMCACCQAIKDGEN